MLKRGLVGYLPVNVVQAIAGFGSIVVFTRLLSPTDYGAYALAFSVTSLAHTLLFTWIEAAMARFHAAETDADGRRAQFATLYRTFALMACALPLVAGLILALTPAPMGLKTAMAAGLASVVFRSLLKLAQERRRAEGAVLGYAVLDVVQTGGGFLLGALFAALGFGGGSPLIGVGAACAAVLVYALPIELRRGQGGRFDPARLSTYAAYGLPLSLSLVMALALATTDRFVLAAYLNEATVGAYHAGYSLSSRTLDVMFIWLGMAGGPAAVTALERGGEAALHTTARAQARLMVLIAVPAAAGLALVARPLAEVMVGPALQAEAAEVTPWIALGALCSGVTTYYLHTAFTLARRTRRLLVAMAIPAGANLVLVLILVPRFGLMGAMWATAASYALGMAAAFVLGRSAIRLPIPWADLGRVIIATGAMALAVIAAPRLGGLVELLVKTAIGGGVYGVTVLALNAAGARARLGEALAMVSKRALGLERAA